MVALATGCLRKVEQERKDEKGEADLVFFCACFLLLVSKLCNLPARSARQFVLYTRSVNLYLPGVNLYLPTFASPVPTN
jgi:hypothetical protein